MVSPFFRGGEVRGTVHIISGDEHHHLQCCQVTKLPCVARILRKTNKQRKKSEKERKRVREGELKREREIERERESE